MSPSSVPDAYFMEQRARQDQFLLTISVRETHLLLPIRVQKSWLFTVNFTGISEKKRQRKERDRERKTEREAERARETQAPLAIVWLWLHPDMWCPGSALIQQPGLCGVWFCM